MRCLIITLTLGAAACLAPVLAKTPAGETAKVKPVAELIVEGGDTGPLKVRQAVYSGDTVRTGSSGEAQIVFHDQTRLVIGRGASLRIDQFVTGGTSRAKRLAIKAFSGVYRFISGKSGSKAYALNTPTAIIGVRGTAFDFSVGRGGRTLVMLHQGVVQVCSTAGGCRILDERCELALTRPGQPAQHFNDPGFLVRPNELARAFPYVRSQGSLRGDFRVSTAGRCRASIARSPEGGGGNGGSGGSGGGQR